MDIDAPLSLDDIYDLELSKHLLELALKFLCLPIAKLFISLFVVKRDDLIERDDIWPICLFHIAMHYANHSLMPWNVTRCYQVFPVALSLVILIFQEEAIFSDHDKFGAHSAKILIEPIPATRANEDNMGTFLRAERIKKSCYASLVLDIRWKYSFVVQNYQSVSGIAWINKDRTFAQHIEVDLRFIECCHESNSSPEKSTVLWVATLSITIQLEFFEVGGGPLERWIVLDVIVGDLKSLLFLNLWHLNHSVHCFHNLIWIRWIDLNDTTKGFWITWELRDDNGWLTELLLPFFDCNEF